MINDIFNTINNNNSILIVNDLNKQGFIKLKTKLELENNNLYLFKIISESEFINLITYSFTNDIFSSNLRDNIKPNSLKELIKFSKYNLDNKISKLNNFINLNNKFILTNNSFLSNKEKFNFYSIGNNLFIKPFLNYYNLNYKHFELNYNSNVILSIINCKLK